MTKFKIVESKKFKNFMAFPLDDEIIDYGTIIFDTAEEAKTKARELAKEKYPEIWADISKW